MKNRINPKSIVYEVRTSIFIFLLPLAMSICLIFYLFDDFNFSKLLITSVIILLINAVSFLQYHEKKIILTKNSIYLFVRGKQIFKWSLVSDFAGIDVRYDKFGKLLGYGTLILVNNNNKMYEYFFLENPNEIKHQIILSYEKAMKELDSDFICTYTLECNNKDM